MKRVLPASIIVGTLVVGWALAGCRGTEQAEAPPPGAGAQPGAGAPLGTPQPAGPFEVTLSTETMPPKAGQTSFEATVIRDGQPVTNATVMVDLSMPSMQMEGPDVTLKPVGDHYEGAAELSMGGMWQAETTVTAGGDTGTAVYQFNATQ